MRGIISTASAHRGRVCSGRHPETEDLVHGGGAAGAELDAAIGHDIEHADSLGHPNRMIERQHHDAMADANAFGAAGHASEENLGRGAVGEFVEEVMLDGPHRIEAEAIGEFDLLERLAINVGLVSRAI